MMPFQYPSNKKLLLEKSTSPVSALYFIPAARYLYGILLSVIDNTGLSAYYITVKA